MPFPGKTFKVTANEQTLGPGKLTVLEDGLLFESNGHSHVGFDFNTSRLVRVTSINSFDIAYSLQGSIQRASFLSYPKYVKKNEGIEKDVTTNPLDWPVAFWKLHTITGAVVARVLVERSGAQSEGFSPVTMPEFESQFGQAYGIISKLPTQKEIETGKVGGQELGELEEHLTNILLRLTDAWLMGNLPSQLRERVAALNYLDHLKRYELGWYHPVPSKYYLEMTNHDYKENAEDWLTEEMMWGSDLREAVSA